MRPADAPLPLLAASGLCCPRGGAQGQGVGPLDFDLHAGQLLHLHGANGSGKTSVLRMLAGLLRPVAGTLRAQGREVAHDPASYFARVAYLGHANGLSADLSVLENLRYALHVSGAPQSDAAIAAGLSTWRLHACLHTPAGRLSQGQARRVALAAVMLGGKPLWLLDEPDAGLDAASLVQLWAMLDAHLDRGGAAVVACHRQPATAADRLLTLNMDDYADADYAVSVGAA
ncbi:heme ABC exporter ATP-binding protein CcmA [Achromobacter piechaudii]|uniref:heme ABC exporter ATP-binding protein CcmA n=1 Tax=Achromobacter piechaudii TaxID=72556 RepID=UPI003DA93375